MLPTPTRTPRHGHITQPLVSPGETPTRADGPPHEAAAESGYGLRRRARLGPAGPGLRPHDRPAPILTALPAPAADPEPGTGSEADPDAELAMLFRAYREPSMGDRLQAPSPRWCMPSGEGKAASRSQGAGRPRLAAAQIAPQGHRGASYQVTQTGSATPPRTREATAAGAATADAAAHAAAGALLSMAAPAAPAAAAALLDPAQARALQAADRRQGPGVVPPAPQPITSASPAHSAGRPSRAHSFSNGKPGGW